MMVYSLGEEERPVVYIEAPILRQYLVSVVGPTKAEYRPGYERWCPACRIDSWDANHPEPRLTDA